MPDSIEASGNSGTDATQGEHMNQNGVNATSHVTPFGSARVNPPNILKFEDSPQEEWELFKSHFEIYTTLTGLASQVKTYQSAMLLNCMGPKGIKIYKNLSFTPEEDQDDIQTIIKKFDQHIIGETNETYERYKFNRRSQKSNEKIDDYLHELREIAKACNFCQCLYDSLIRDKIVIGINDNNTRKKMLETRDLTLKDAIDIARSSEAAQEQMKQLSLNNEEVNKIFNKKFKSKSTTKDDHQTEKKIKPTQVKECMFCGKQHEMLKSKCPAWGKRCAKCKKRNHFANKCDIVNSVENNQSEEDDDEEEDSQSDGQAYGIQHNLINAVKTTKSVYAKLQLDDMNIKFQIDSGATTNLIPAKYVKKEVKKVPSTLTMWNGARVTPEGQCKLRIHNPKPNKSYIINFTVVKEDFMPIIGKESAEKMNLLTINYHNFIIAKIDNEMKPEEEIKEVFKDEIGTLPGPPVKFTVDESVTPVISPCRREPIALKEKIKVELNRLCNEGIIERVDKPTNWLNQVCFREKSDGNVRLCLDPRPLNKALKRERTYLTTMEDVLPKLSNAKIFSKLDLRSGYHHICLDEESSVLTTFTTEEGCYKFNRLPFGLNISSEIFQKRLLQAINHLENVVCVADDIICFGKGASKEEALQNHDKHLSALLKTCQMNKIRLNYNKCSFRKTEITFLGHKITEKGLQPDPEKIKAITEMTAPSNKSEVQSLQGTINYLGKYLANLSDTLEPIRKLLNEGVKFEWTHIHQRAFEKIKKQITMAPILSFYQPEKELTIQCDASNTGLGAVMLQEGKPIAYKSKSLTDTEKRYATIEKEMLAITWSLEKFHDYTYARKVTIHSDHKPLQAIVQKPLSKAPRRLQNLLMRALNYDFEIIWKKGEDQKIADMLSRASITGDDTEEIHIAQHLPMRPEKLDRYREETEKDEVLQELKHLITSCWPERENTPTLALPYYSYKEELSIQDGLIFRGERLIIPKSMRNQVMQEIHTGHGGEQACLRRARESIFWAGMTADIKVHVQKCETCRTFETRNQKETLIPHEIPERPWEKVGMDTFYYRSKDYLLVVDYYSNFWEVEPLKQKTSNEIIYHLKKMFSRYGIPNLIISDNATAFTSEEFRDFTIKWDIVQQTSSPEHPKGNGLAEAHVKIAKNILRKCNKDNQDIYLALLNHRNTPQENNPSPAQRLFDRSTRSIVPITTSKLQKRNENIKNNKLKQVIAKHKYDKTAKDLQQLREGDQVRIQPRQLGEAGREWKKGVILQKLDSRSYEISMNNGNILRRNRSEIKPTKENERANDTMKTNENNTTKIATTESTNPTPLDQRQMTPFNQIPYP